MVSWLLRVWRALSGERRYQQRHNAEHDTIARRLNAIDVKLRDYQRADLLLAKRRRR